MTTPTGKTSDKTAEEPKRATESKTVAIYKAGGLSVRRVINPADFKRMGVDGQKQLVWERENAWTVDLTGVSPVIHEFLKKDPTFEVKTVES